MKNIDSPEKLLRLLAIKGDPTAFYLLIIPFAKITYMSLRNNGIDHKSALEMLRPFIQKLYYDRETLARAEGAQQWYEKTGKKMRISEQAQSTEVMLDHIVPPNAALFESDLQTLLLQMQNRERTGETPSLLQRRIFRLGVKGALTAGILIALIAGIYAALVVTQTHLCLTLVGPQSAFSFVLPFDFEQNTPPAIQAARPDSALRQETSSVLSGPTKTGLAPMGETLPAVKKPISVKPFKGDTLGSPALVIKSTPPVKKAAVPVVPSDSPADSSLPESDPSRKTGIQGSLPDTDGTNRYPQY
jgi:hypothetical protein